MNEITKEVRNILLSNADSCINKFDEFSPSDEVLDEIALSIIPMDSFVLTDAFEMGGDEGFDTFVKGLTKFIFSFDILIEDFIKKPYEGPQIRTLLLSRLRVSIRAMCDDFEPDVREAIKEHQKEVKAESVLTPFHLQMKILGDGMDRILGKGGEDE